MEIRRFQNIIKLRHFPIAGLLSQLKVLEGLQTSDAGILSGQLLWGNRRCGKAGALAVLSEYMVYRQRSRCTLQCCSVVYPRAISILDFPTIILFNACVMAAAGCNRSPDNSRLGTVALGTAFRSPTGTVPDETDKCKSAMQLTLAVYLTL